ncbi:carboxypeptidase regulatory-like domain-containing protein [Chryseobacterium sp. SNU WT5]|uniref:carboxypeptidase regulatory-like domain-containing protein n=1 Tax=Chryseobacterium sp. SNU WT5 TaxID=2594269 RepID=UPI00117E3A53|nr:carboxypeptidase regulatory-like domain-containing protein [Chryseobacterium sp. SNU WT5]QDP85608.1 carboxypeptidase regulatory-like domain-containing protein [Chryseobacterium sp. SNU WT5]
MCRIVVLFLFCLSFNSFGQQVSGIVTDDEGNLLRATMVFNMKTEQKSYTNSSGEFSIEANVRDELRFIRAGFERTSRIVNQYDLSNQLKVVIIRSAENIEEVKVPAVRLTGDLDKDTRNLAKLDKVAQLQREVGVPGPPEKPRETPPPTIERAGVLRYALSNLNFNNLYKNISGDARRMRTLYRYEDLQDHISWLRERIPDEYFIKMGIPEEKISEFLQFSIGVQPEITKGIEVKNLSKVLFLLEETFPIYIDKMSMKAKP